MAFFDTFIRIIPVYEGAAANAGLKKTEAIAKEAAENAAKASKKAAEDGSRANKKAARETAAAAKKAAKESGDAAKKAAKEAEAAAKKAAQAMEQLGKRLAQSLQTVGRNLTTFVTLPILGIGIAALKTSADFEKGMNRVRALTQAAGDQFEAMEEQAKELGSTTVFTASQAADAMGFLALAGFEANQIISVMPTTLELAAAAQIELAQAADITTNILAGFRLEVEDLAAVNDVLVETTISTNTNMLELAEAMKLVAPIAASAGTELTEVSAIIGLLGNNALKGSIAGTTLRNTFAALLIPTKAEADALRDLGITTKDASGTLLPLVDIIEQLEHSSAKAGDFLEIFGLRAGPGMAALIGEGSEKLRELIQSLKDSGGIAKEVSDIQLEGLSGALLKLKSVTEGFLIAIGDSGLLELATEFIEDISKMISGFKELDIEQQKAIIGWALFAASIGPVLIGMGALLKGFLALREVMVLIKAAALASSFAPMVGIIASLGPILLGAAGIIAAITIYANEQKRLNRIVEESVGPINEQIKAMRSEIREITSLDVEIGKLITANDNSAESFDEVRERMIDLIETNPEYARKLGITKNETGDLFDATGDLIENIHDLDIIMASLNADAYINELDAAIRVTASYSLAVDTAIRKTEGWTTAWANFVRRQAGMEQIEYVPVFNEETGGFQIRGVPVGTEVDPFGNEFPDPSAPGFLSGITGGRLGGPIVDPLRVQIETALRARVAEAGGTPTEDVFQRIVDELLVTAREGAGGGGAGAGIGGGGGGAGGGGGGRGGGAADIINAERQALLDRKDIATILAAKEEERIQILDHAKQALLDYISKQEEATERLDALLLAEADAQKLVEIKIAEQDIVQAQAVKDALTEGIQELTQKQLDTIEAQNQIAEDFLKGLTGVLGKFFRSLGRTDVLGPVGTDILGLGATALAASLPQATSGIFAKKGLLAGLGPDIFSSLAMGAAGFALESIFGGDEPLEIAQPVDINIVDIETRLLNFFNFRGISSFTESQEFIPIFENGLY